MFATLQILLPIFALIFAGFLLRRRGIASAAACVELNRFVVWLALPALLFKLMAHASWTQLYQPGFVATFGLASAMVFAATLAWRLRAGRHLADASVDAIAASYANTAYIGFPLIVALFGDAGIVPTTVATLMVVSVLFAIAAMLVEVGLQTERRPHKVGLKVLRGMSRNPLIVAPLAGALAAASGLRLPAPAESFLNILGAAATPCALVCLGLFLAEKRPAARTPSASLVLTAGKLVVQPALTWWLAARVFMLPGPLAQMAVLLAALPTGTGPFMLAEFYRREAFVTARTILLSTVGSLVSLTVLLRLMPHGG
ncbi:transporter [Bordetella genomosp. 9]|uniref:Transporter n=1 Tax=Bordetella genomosp. 9 TaxID=1416803 RepID=A0A261R5E8_9BORD|nr:AEC family transporter [Bordetella genomosp. 9]OZI20249.1 transporter [Bordetella genomosp. 9]